MRIWDYITSAHIVIVQVILIHTEGMRAQRIYTAPLSSSVLTANLKENDRERHTTYLSIDS